MVKVLSQLFRPFYDRLGSVTQTIDAGLSFVLKSYLGPGTASIIVHGDGDPRFQLLVIYDDRVRTLSPTEVRLVTVSFNHMLRIAIRNPRTTAITGTIPTIEVNGIMKE